MTNTATNRATREADHEHVGDTDQNIRRDQHAVAEHVDHVGIGLASATFSQNDGSSEIEKNTPPKYVSGISTNVRMIEMPSNVSRRSR